MLKYLAITILCLLGVHASRRSHTNSQQPKLFDEFLINAIYKGEILDVEEEDLELIAPGNIPASSEDIGAVRQPNFDFLSRRMNGQTSDDDSQASSSRSSRRHRHGNRVRISSRNITDQASADITSRISLSDILSREGVNSTGPSSNSNDPSSIASRRFRSMIGESSRSNVGEMLSGSFDLNQLQALEVVPRDHWPCCDLGSLAGDKGFLCNAQFYASRVTNRVANRVHNRRLSTEYFNNGAPTTDGQRILERFNTCVTHDSNAREFEGCCQRALQQTLNRHRLSRNFRRAISVS